MLSLVSCMVKVTSLNLLILLLIVDRILIPMQAQWVAFWV